MPSKRMLTPVVNPETLLMSMQEQEVEPQAWTADVFVPLTQNLCGGIAVGMLGYMGYMAYTASYGAALSGSSARLWCLLAGGAVACLMTILRFFSDDLGIVVAAYKAGQRSMLPRISALEENLHAMQDVLQGTQQRTSAEARLAEVMSRASTDAERLIRLHFEGDKIDRKSMTERGMGQRDWERARRLLQAAGVLNHDGTFAVLTPVDGIKRLNSRCARDVGKQQQNHAYVPSWQ
jgi:hypothetical protein